MRRPNASAMDKIALCKIGHLAEGDPEALGRLMDELAIGTNRAPGETCQAH